MAVKGSPSPWQSARGRLGSEKSAPHRMPAPSVSCSVVSEAVLPLIFSDAPTGVRTSASRWTRPSLAGAGRQRVVELLEWRHAYLWATGGVVDVSDLGEPEDLHIG